MMQYTKWGVANFPWAVSQSSCNIYSISRAQYILYTISAIPNGCTHASHCLSHETIFLSKRQNLIEVKLETFKLLGFTLFLVIISVFTVSTNR